MKLKVSASALNLRRTPSTDGAIIGSLAQNDIVEQMAVSDDQKWIQVQKGAHIGWASQRYLVPAGGNDVDVSIEKIFRIANTSAIATYSWKNRGVAPRGYIKGMALVFARVYCKLLQGDIYALEMAKADTGKRATDALTFYAAKFGALGMNNEATDGNTLRHLFVLQMGLGMRESSGRWYVGRDTTASNTASDTAEAGLFQTSWNAHASSPLLAGLFEAYSATPNGFLDVFKEGAPAPAQGLQNYGAGVGRDFQKLTKECPAFAVEFAAIGLRNIRSHWGPINRFEAEIRPEADTMFLRVQQAVETFDLCSVVL